MGAERVPVVDIHSPPDVHLGPLLVIAPALAGPRLSAGADWVAGG
ncbi:hypothetical protein A6P39_035200 [Streptomyces sp. FXJ1.172]|nr:hypothetical protein [Streptomyces sp. FXJ1.172]WEO98872.1 hypothetical protein A6P39_035200 [Streptomyces sp. FXJ1.172]